MKGNTMKKNTWKKIAIATTGVAVTSIAVIFKLVSELEEVNYAHYEALKTLADEGYIQNLKNNGVPYMPDL
jgi:hypothetical protein